ncbi:CBS domain-containing protein [Oceanobacillus luteolus]|uniref:CBS domain-containing protein n=1 Tax=Oceanobacillus luteolus TaxID=1274358 RepID=A0ABW4HSE4_9BACI|nr:CBS domain-containing protein [Oceanobacillus luteolus]MCM3739633.1 CBS domain-containing protein [Oceanobacillus luteolus]
MYRNSERFLTAFNRIEKKMKEIINNGRNLGFSKMVHMLKHRNAIIGRYSDDLLEFAELRNAIVHNKVDMTYAIAEPHGSTVSRIECIEKELLQPRLVSPQFIKEVIYLQETERLTKLLALIHEKKVTKFPVYHEQKFKGLISQRAIAFWLAGNMYRGNKLPEDATVKEVLDYETNDNYRFIPANTSVLEAVDIFKKQFGRGNRLEALLITNNGIETEKLIGIITNLDIIGVQHV